MLKDRLRVDLDELKATDLLPTFGRPTIAVASFMVMTFECEKERAAPLLVALCRIFIIDLPANDDREENAPAYRIPEVVIKIVVVTAIIVIKETIVLDMSKKKLVFHHAE